MIFTSYKQRGIGLIEVLVSLVILAVGLLSVAKLQVEILATSNDSKAKNEAIIIAQTRIEELRNFSDGISTTAEFEAEFAEIVKGNSTDISGVNAVFTRKESIVDANNVKSISVYVTWNDKVNDTQEVSINSSIGWQKPRSVGDSSGDIFEPLIPSVSGRAKLGDGIIDMDTVTTIPTGDGMHLYNSLDGDYRLVDKLGTIVLTLLDACDLGTGVCTDFVKISGRVYIDKSTQSNLSPGSVFVKASDAAFCQQYYYDDNGDLQELASGNSSAAETSPNSNYTYYNYTCYLGGGWHGNIGIILEGGISQSDKVCQGDPTSIDAYADPVIAARRVYRGMTYKIDGNGDAIVDANGDTLYYSIGVSDALELPATGESGHDFVVSSLNVNDTTGDKCISESILVRADSYYSLTGVSSLTAGKLFEGNPTDFFCLNENSSYIDNFDSSVFNFNNTCPFDPSDPPSDRHVISGTILVNTNLSIDSDIAAITVNTSDGSGNCTIATFTKPSSSQYSITYECDVFDWGNGWDGYIQFNTDSSLMTCDYYRETHTAITNDFNAGNNTCSMGEVLTVSGTVLANGNKVITNAQTSDAGGQCQVSADGASYTCKSDLLATGVLWTGRLTFETNGHKLCISDPVLTSGTFSIYDGTSSIAWIDLAGVDKGNLSMALQVITNNATCP